MRFCDMFISYKIGLKSIKRTSPFIKLPLYRKIVVIVNFVIFIVSFLLFMFQKSVVAIVALLIGIALFMVFIESKKHLKYMLNEHLLKYSQKRMDMVIGILRKYHIDIHDTNTIDLLIDEAQKAQIQSDYLLPLKNH